MDIDIAIDNMYGKQFAEFVNRFLEEVLKVPTRFIAVIQSNPDQSKHLETATMKIFDKPIDLVNLRHETYSTDSRIPHMQIGTPYEDAMRRDFTINALFYNLHTREVEDFTQRGLDDLRHGLLRTPLPPSETFMDDPLRVLRAIRFASRFEFAVVREIAVAASSPAIHEALHSKVSKERFGKELDGMLKARRPSVALRYLQDFGLWSILFGPSSGAASDARTAIRAVQFLEECIAGGMPELLCLSEGFRRLAVLACICWHRHIDALSTELQGQHYTSKSNAVRQVICDSIKLPVKDAADVCKIVGAAHAAVRHQVAEFAVSESAFRRLETGLMMRATGPMWILAVVVDYCMVASGADALPAPQSDAPSMDAASAHWWRDVYSRFIRYILHVERLDRVWEMKPLLNGKELSSLLELKPGPVLGVVNERAIAWQLEHPAGSSEELLMYLKQTLRQEQQ